MRRVPAIHDGLVVRQIGTPLTHARFLRRHRGNYGLALAAGGCGALHALPPHPEAAYRCPPPASTPPSVGRSSTSAPTSSIGIALCWSVRERLAEDRAAA